MAKDPAYPMYAQDFDMDTASWGIDEIGIYIRLLNYEWINGFIPNDLQRISKIARISPRKLQKSWEIISKKFSQSGTDKLQNKRMEEEREKRLKYIESQRESGKRGAEKRWKGHGDPISKPNGENMALHLQSSSSTIKDKENTSKRVPYITKRKRKLNGKRLESFELFWDAFNYKAGKAEAADSWIDIPELTDALVNKIISEAKRTAKDRPEIIKKGGTPKMAQGWLSSRRWEDEFKGIPERKIIEVDI